MKSPFIAVVLLAVSACAGPPLQSQLDQYAAARRGEAYRGPGAGPPAPSAEHVKVCRSLVAAMPGTDPAHLGCADVARLGLSVATLGPGASASSLYARPSDAVAKPSPRTSAHGSTGSYCPVSDTLVRIGDNDIQAIVAHIRSVCEPHARVIFPVDAIGVIMLACDPNKSITTIGRTVACTLGSETVTLTIGS